MKLNNTTRDALNWCLLLETRMTEDIHNILGKGIWHKFTFTNQISENNFYLFKHHFLFTGQYEDMIKK
jgi:hypothetical protein